MLISLPDEPLRAADDEPRRLHGAPTRATEHATAPDHDSSLALAPLVGLVERLQRENVEMAGRIGRLEAENAQLRALATPTISETLPEPWWSRWVKP